MPQVLDIDHYKKSYSTNFVVDNNIIWVQLSAVPGWHLPKVGYGGQTAAADTFA